MSKLLLDTHTFLWFVIGSDRLSSTARLLIENINNERFLSVASIGKLVLVQSLDKFLIEQMARNCITLLPIGLAHAAHVATLPFHHRDPFDRLMVAQATLEDMAMVSVDDALDDYGIKRIW